MADLVEKKAFPTDIAGKLAVATDYKNKGNAYFKEGKYNKAIVNYSKALAYTKGLPGRKEGLEGVGSMAADAITGEKITPEVEKDVSNLEVVLKTNIATCYIKTSNGIKALEVIREALAIRPTAWKSLMRKAEATILIGDYDKANTILDEASANGPDESGIVAINAVRERALKLSKKADAKQKKAFGKIFD